MNEDTWQFQAFKSVIKAAKQGDEAAITLCREFGKEIMSKAPVDDLMEIMDLLVHFRKGMDRKDAEKN